jgi:hypothetical protein
VRCPQILKVNRMKTDLIVQEVHAIRKQLLDQAGGDLHRVEVSLECLAATRLGTEERKSQVLSDHYS